ncbi:NUDIX domain-containing protein [Candidatus Uhrbacteria bacterium]|nr:NUDIX domain-containing protein [Candidatus Uhrbacteria bacterium]
MKKGELLEDALRREVKEEYCVDILEYQYLGFREVHRVKEGKPTHWIVFDYRVRIDPTLCAIGDPEKMEDITWCAPDALPSPMHSQWPDFFSRYKILLNIFG